MTRRIVSALLFSLLPISSLLATGVTVEWATSRVETGSHVGFVVHLPKNAVLDQVSVSIRQTNADWELAGEKESALTVSGKSITGRIQCFAVEDGMFPGLRIGWVENGRKQFFSSPPVWFFVAAPVTDLSAQPPVRGLRGPVSAGLPWLLIFGIFLVLVLLGWTWFIVRKRKKGFVLPDANQIADPWELASRRIEILRENLPEDELAIKEHIFLLTETLKQYLSGRSGLHLVEQTSREVIASVREFAWAGNDMTDEIREWLERGDMAKFARQIPTPGELTGYLESLAAWLERIESQWKTMEQAREGEP